VVHVSKEVLLEDKSTKGVWNMTQMLAFPLNEGE
jgi:hypothetical protein